MSTKQTSVVASPLQFVLNFIIRARERVNCNIGLSAREHKAEQQLLLHLGLLETLVLPAKADRGELSRRLLNPPDYAKPMAFLRAIAADVAGLHDTFDELCTQNGSKSASSAWKLVQILDLLLPDESFSWLDGLKKQHNQDRCWARCSRPG